MKIKRHAAVISFVAVGALALSACGTDDNSPDTNPGGQANAACNGKESLKASGSSAQANAVTRFANAYEDACQGKSLDYTSSGSGAGVKDFIGRQTDFAGSDSPLDPEDGEVKDAKQRCDGNDAWHLPIVFGPIAITYNVPGVDKVALDAPTLAKIFSGQIKKWNDPAIAKLNEGAKLPDQNITVIYRNDESGTTDNFQKYLDAASNGVWKGGDGKTFNGDVGEGAKGNEGTSAAVKGTPGSITYNEWSYAEQQNLAIANIVNSGGGKPVELSEESVGKAIEGAKLEGEGHDMRLDLESLYKADAQGAYPLVLATYEIVCSKYSDPATANAVKSFLQIAINDGQQGLADNGYIPVPQAFKQKLESSVKAISSTS
ncbi:MAG: phosphate ABC transporter substrate-binding protein PstS [Pseudonocardiaceae bacterium]|nr:phosphate ABC transporter substrate-binding protein PstS [Pseudonocardiaceae bacterium]